MPKLKNTAEQDLTEQFQIALLKKGWSQKHLGVICGKSQPQISRIFANPSKHNYSTICEVASKLGIRELPVI